MKPYTKTPKWVHRAIIDGSLKPTEARVLLVITEATKGFNRDAYRLTDKGIAETLGVHVNHVRPALAALIEKGMILSGDEGLSLASDDNEIRCETATKSVATEPEKRNEIRCGKQRNPLQNATKSVAETGAKPALKQGSSSPLRKEVSKEFKKNTPSSTRFTREELTSFDEAKGSLNFPPEHLPTRVRETMISKVRSTPKYQGAGEYLSQFDSWPWEKKRTWYVGAMEAAKASRPDEPGIWLSWAAGTILTHLINGTDLKVVPFSKEKAAVQAEPEDPAQKYAW